MLPAAKTARLLYGKVKPAKNWNGSTHRGRLPLRYCTPIPFSGIGMPNWDFYGWLFDGKGLKAGALNPFDALTLEG
jgi:hypothetical protein